jgi:hypothetical protein
MAKTRRKKMKRTEQLFGGGVKRKHTVSATRHHTLRSDREDLDTMQIRLSKGKGPILDIPGVLIAINRKYPRMKAVQIGEIEERLKRINFLIEKEIEDKLVADQLSYVPSTSHSGRKGSREPIAGKGSAFRQLTKEVKSMFS